MAGRRLPWIAAGGVLILAALLLLVRSLPAGDSAADSAAGSDPATAPRAASTAQPPAWSELALVDEEPVARPRLPVPVSVATVAGATEAADPFDRALRHRTARGPTPAAELRLQAVVTGARPMALISGHLLRPGDAIGSYRLSRVEPSAVHLAGASPRRLVLPPADAESGR